MPQCLVQTYWKHIERLRAERSLSAATIGALPYMNQTDRGRWYDQQQARLDGLAELVQEGPARVSPLSFNGVPMSVPQLKAKVAGVLGTGYSE